MKKSILITTLAIFSLPFFSASAQDYDGREDYRDRNEHRHRWDHRRSSDYRQLRAELDQLNRMFAHVRVNLRTYGTDRHLWREYSRLLRDRDRLDYELQSRSYVPAPRQMYRTRKSSAVRVRIPGPEVARRGVWTGSGLPNEKNRVIERGSRSVVRSCRNHCAYQEVLKRGRCGNRRGAQSSPTADHLAAINRSTITSI